MSATKPLRFALDMATLEANWKEACRPMESTDLREVAQVEGEIYPFPWTLRNFADSLFAGYEGWVVHDQNGLLGYCVLMMVMDEAHLLNISVAAEAQGNGVGRLLLAWAERVALMRSAASLLLEVRPSNHIALGFYERHGYARIGLRKGYYPAVKGREDAIVMRKTLIAAESAGTSDGERA